MDQINNFDHKNDVTRAISNKIYDMWLLNLPAFSQLNGQVKDTYILEYFSWNQGLV